MPELYRGLVPTIIGVIPYGAIAFSTNEAIKRTISEYNAPSKCDKYDLKTWQKLFSGGCAGIFAQTCTYPLEIMRRRMQTAGYIKTNASIESTYTSTISVHDLNTKNIRSRLFTSMNMVETVSFLYNAYGWRVFYKGLSLNWIKGPITVSISFTTFDFFKNILDQYVIDRCV